VKDGEGKPVDHFFINQSGDAKEPYWKLADSQRPAIKGVLSRVNLAELEEMLKEEPDIPQQMLAERFGVGVRMIQKKLKELVAKKTGYMPLPKSKKK
jgi:hypothetical protein